MPARTTEIPSSVPSTRARRLRIARVLLIAAALAGCLVLLWPDAWASAQNHARAYVAQQLTLATGRQVDVATLKISRDGAQLEGIRVHGRTGEPDMIVQIARVDIQSDWWRDVVSQQLVLDRVRLEGVDGVFVLPVSAQPQSDARAVWTAQVLDLARLGVHALEVHRGSVRMQTTDGSMLGEVRDADATLQLEPTHFGYEIHAGILAGAGLQATTLALSGGGTAGDVVVEKLSVDVAHGHLDLKGRMNPVTLDVHAVASVHGVAVHELRGLPFWPERLTVRSAVDAELQLDAGARGVERVTGQVHARAGSVAQGHQRFAWQNARAQIEITPQRVSLTHVRASALGVAANGNATVALTAHPTLRADGQLVVPGRAMPGLARRLGVHPGGWRARRVTVAFRVSGPLEHPGRMAMNGHVRVDGLTVPATANTAKVTVARADADVSFTRSRIALRNVAAHARGLDLHGAFAIVPQRHGAPRFDAQATLDVHELDALRRIAPDANAWRWLTPARADAGGAIEARATGTLGAQPSVAIAGDFVARSLRVEAPEHAIAPLEADHVRGAFSFARDGSGQEPTYAELRDVQMYGPDGRATASAQIVGDRWHASIAAQGVPTGLVSARVPGLLKGGHADVTAEIDGDATRLLRSVSGHVEARDMRYTPPSDMPFSARTLAVSHLGGDFAWRPEGLSVRAITLRADRLDGEGSLEVENGVARLRADIRSANLGAVADAFPMFTGIVRGGSGQGRLDLTVDATGARGEVAMDARGGSIVVPALGAGAAFGPIPLSTGHAVIAFSPGDILVRDISLRGPMANADANLAWHADTGALRIQGSAWLTHEYTYSMLVGWRWLAHIVRFRRIGTDFDIAGTDTRPVLHASAAHGLLWHLGRGKLPRDVQQMARGERPLWDRSTVAAVGPVL